MHLGDKNYYTRARLQGGKKKVFVLLFVLCINTCSFFVYKWSLIYSREIAVFTLGSASGSSSDFSGLGFAAGAREVENALNTGCRARLERADRTKEGRVGTSRETREMGYGYERT